MSNTIQKYKDYVMTGFMKSVVPIVIDQASGAKCEDEKAANISIVSPEFPWSMPDTIILASSPLPKRRWTNWSIAPLTSIMRRQLRISQKRLPTSRPHGLTKSFFGNGGAEAIEGAMKLARLYTGKHEFISLARQLPWTQLGHAEPHWQSGPQKTWRPVCCWSRFCSRTVRISVAMAK